MDTPWVEIALEALEELDEHEVVAGLHELGAPLADEVMLVEGEVSATEAMAYARVLIGLGRELEARAVVSALVDPRALRYAAAK